MTINILYFGLVAEAIQCSQEKLVFNNTTSVKEIKKILVDKHNVLEKLSYQIAVDQKLASDNQILTTASEIAILPPFSGG
ncbi:MoaD/ThiS family protein [Aquimarina agarilytica]|uniref:MoaD/ThiS family protein n=1 Tax=Aquimarina agarilytica TaxID=1087449 RepID=UPI00028A1639|nr:MoaD/ThiS family protein [Aquimarina agarilytica]